MFQNAFLSALFSVTSKSSENAVMEIKNLSHLIASESFSSNKSSVFIYTDRFLIHEKTTAAIYIILKQILIKSS